MNKNNPVHLKHFLRYIGNGNKVTPRKRVNGDGEGSIAEQHYQIF